MFKSFKKDEYSLHLNQNDCEDGADAYAAALGVSPKRLASLPPPVEPMKGAGVYLRLDKEPCTDAADRFVEGLLGRIQPSGARNTPTMKAAAAALVGDLLSIDAGGADDYGFRAVGINTFSGERIGYNPFNRVRKRLVDAGYVRVAKGKVERPIAGQAGQATRFQPLPPLIDLAGSFGITAANVALHREVGMPGGCYRYDKRRRQRSEAVGQSKPPVLHPLDCSARDTPYLAARTPKESHSACRGGLSHWRTVERPCGSYAASAR